MLCKHGCQSESTYSWSVETKRSFYASEEAERCANNNKPASRRATKSKVGGARPARGIKPPAQRARAAHVTDNTGNASDAQTDVDEGSEQTDSDAAEAPLPAQGQLPAGEPVAAGASGPQPTSNKEVTLNAVRTELTNIFREQRARAGTTCTSRSNSYWPFGASATVPIVLRACRCCHSKWLLQCVLAVFVCSEEQVSFLCVQRSCQEAAHNGRAGRPKRKAALVRFAQ